MSNVVICVEDLTKEYRLGVINHGTLRQDLQSWWAKALGKEDPNSIIAPGVNSDELSGNPHMLALKDVSFDVEEGEILGIIGHNGAGKSTLLKILSRVTAPTRGAVKIKGRVASLLEVGTGFHPELTGRENVYLNGAILGMAKKEINSKFDEIVDFSGIDKFIDTPVKRYSSGMHVRLAFAVAAHLDPEILIIDEVLAVGDAQFQKKCLGKMGEVGRDGRTVLFVSHNMGAVENLCKAGIVLGSGSVVYKGEIVEAIKFYLNSFLDKIGGTDISSMLDRGGEGHVRIIDLQIEDKVGNKNIPFQIGAELFFYINYKADKEVKNPRMIIGIYDLMNVGVTRFDTEITGGLPSVLPDAGQIVCSTESVPLAPGRYFINIAFFSNEVMQDYLAGVAFLDIIGSDFFKTGKIFSESDSKLTKVLVRHKWSLSHDNS